MDLERMANREILRYAVQRTITCPLNGRILDVRTAVHIEASRDEKIITSLTVSAEVYDETVKKNVEQTTGSLANVDLKIYDGRELFA